MKIKPKLKWTLDVLMTIALLFLMGYQFWGEASHEWIGAGMFVLFIGHQVCNLNWYKNLFRGKYTPMRIFQTLINLLTLAAMLMQIYSGIILSRHVFAFLPIQGGMALARRMHILGSYWGFLFMSLHLGLHWGMILNVAAKIGNRGKAGGNKFSVVSFLAGLAAAAYGLVVFIKRNSAFILILLILSLSSCGQKEDVLLGEAAADGEQDREVNEAAVEAEKMQVIDLSAEIMELEEGLTAVRFDGDYKFADFLAQGGASSDGEVVGFLAENLLDGVSLDGIMGNIFGCSTLAAADFEGGVLFGRNFDWNHCDAMVVASYPEDGYVSISTVNVDFITQGAGSGSVGMALKLDQVRTLAALYAPLDGMNEKGFAISVNMIQDSDTIEQNTDRPDITTTTAVRLLLNQASDVEEALEILGQYDMHASMGFMVHFAMADRSGRSVAVEYVDNEMVVVETPVVTNFYLAEGEKQGIGTRQSHDRFDILTETIAEKPFMTQDEVRDALDSVSKDNFGEFESTEWSIVFDQSALTAAYYHRENYEKAYFFQIRGE